MECLREAAKNKDFFFSLKIAGNGFCQKKILRQIFGAMLLTNIATNLSKKNDFANIVHLSIDMSS